MSTGGGRRRGPARRGGGVARARTVRGEPLAGQRFEVEAGPIAHGGHVVARHEGRAVFVRHALPGERIVVEITEGGSEDRFWRADAVEVLAPSPDRVTPPCRFAGPGGCGGCDLQHVAVPAQRLLKAQVVREQLQRLGGLGAPDADPATRALVDALVVEAVPGDVDGLHWRTRQRYVSLPDGGRGMRKHRSHDVVEIDECLLEADDAAGDSADAGPGTDPHDVRGVHFDVAPGGFWQVHPGAPEVLLDTVLSYLAPGPGERALDLYAGVGLFARFLADAVGSTGRVSAVEGDRAATDRLPVNVPGVDAHTGDVAAVLAALPPDPVDVVVLDPPREGARRPVVEQIARRTPRAVAYVACDPAALARDVALFAEHGYRLTALRALDLFPMTHHVECVALLEPAGAGSDVGAEA